MYDNPTIFTTVNLFSAPRVWLLQNVCACRSRLLIMSDLRGVCVYEFFTPASSAVPLWLGPCRFWHAVHKVSKLLAVLMSAPTLPRPHQRYMFGGGGGCATVTGPLHKHHMHTVFTLHIMLGPPSRGRVCMHASLVATPRHTR